MIYKIENYNQSEFFEMDKAEDVIDYLRNRDVDLSEYCEIQCYTDFEAHKYGREQVLNDLKQGKKFVWLGGIIVEPIFQIPTNLFDEVINKIEQLSSDKFMENDPYSIMKSTPIWKRSNSFFNDDEIEELNNYLDNEFLLVYAENEEENLKATSEEYKQWREAQPDLDEWTDEIYNEEAEFWLDLHIQYYLVDEIIKEIVGNDRSKRGDYTC